MIILYLSNRDSRLHSRRVGTTTVEFAIILPLFLLLTIGGMQLFRYSIVANAVETAVMEGARKGIIVGATDSQVEAAARLVLDQAGLTGYSVTVNRINSSGGISDLSIKAQLSLTGNGFLAPTFGTSWMVSRSCTIRCE